MEILQSVSSIGIVILIYLIVFGYFWTKYQQDYILANWGEYRCNPMIIPFANNINPGVSTSKNFEFCMHQMEQMFFNILSAPFISMLKVMQNIMQSIINSFNSIRQLVNIIRQRIEDVINNLMSRFQNMEDELRFFLIKIKDMLGKVNGVMRVSEYTFLVLSYALNWIFEIPGLIALVVIIVLIGLLGLFMFFAPYLVGIVIALSLMIVGVGSSCFDKNTLIKMSSGKLIPIHKLKLNDKIYGGGKITSIMKFIANKNKMYNYLGQIVSGDHLVFEKNKGWIRVEQSIHSDLIQHYGSKFIYCLNTENNIIITRGDIIFSDYNEIGNIDIISKLNYFIKQTINTNIYCYDKLFPENKDLEAQITGFHGKTMIKTISNEKPISEIKIGDKLINNQKVTGIIKNGGKDIRLFNYRGIILSGSNMIYEDNKWIRVYQSKLAKVTNLKEKYIYHITVNSNQIIVNNLYFLDFHETNNLFVNLICDHISSLYKNNNLNFKKDKIHI